MVLRVFNQQKLITYCWVLALLATVTMAETPFSVVNSSDPGYTDACIVAGTTCQLCWLTDRVLCTMDLTIWNSVTDRDLWKFWYAIAVIACVVIALPFFCVGIYFCTTYQITCRWCSSRGRTLCEIIKRCCCLFCINFDRGRRNGSCFNKCGKVDKAIDYSKLGL